MTFEEFQNKVKALQSAYGSKIEIFRVKRSYGLFCNGFYEIYAYRALKFLSCTTEAEFLETCACVSQKDILQILNKASERLC